MTRVIDFFFDFRIRDLLSEENKSKGIEFYPLTARRLRPLRDATEKVVVKSYI